MTAFFPPEPEGPSPQPQRRTNRRRRWVLRFVAVTIALIAVTATAVGIYVGSVSRSFTESVQRGSLLPPPVSSAAPEDPSASPLPQRPAKANTEAINYVLMGSDSRNTGNAGSGRSDTLMVMHLAADRKSAYLISFPRDMYVTIPGHGKNKINAAFAFGGPQLAVATLEQMLGTRMDHVALVDFAGFINLTEQLGGVTVVNRHASASRGYTFPAGEITVKGDQALAYVRERYGLPNGDLDRAERQRDVVKAILKKGLSRDTLTDPAKLSGFAAGVGKHLTVDEDFTDAKMRRTALSLRLGADDVKSLQAPISGFGTANGQSIDVVDEKQLTKLGRALREDTMATYEDR